MKFSATTTLFVALAAFTHRYACGQGSIRAKSDIVSSDNGQEPALPLSFQQKKASSDDNILDGGDTYENEGLSPNVLDGGDTFENKSLSLRGDEQEQNNGHALEEVGMGMIPYDKKEETRLYDARKCEAQQTDLCGTGSSCEALKKVFLQLCFSVENNVDCSSDCSHILDSLEQEATNQGIDMHCVQYAQKLSHTCKKESLLDHDDEEILACNAEVGWSTDLRPGESESMDCHQLYPAYLKTGKAHRYCLLDGTNLIYEDCSVSPHEKVVRNKTSDTRGIVQVTNEVSKDSNNMLAIKDGAEKGTSLLSDSVEVFAALNEAGALSAKVGKVLSVVGPTLGAVGIAFSVVNLFLGEPESAELAYMKAAFAQVNNKLDALSSQLGSVEERLTYTIMKQDFEQYKARMAVCGARLTGFQRDPSESSKSALRNSCCEEDDDPLEFLHWLGNGQKYQEYAGAAAKALDYNMANWIKEMKGVSHVATVAGYMNSVCSSLIYSKDEAAKQIEAGVDLTTKILQAFKTQVASMPNEYLNKQLVPDIRKVVADSRDTTQCADSMKAKINHSFKGWKHKPLASAYCYGKTYGWDNHGRSVYNHKQEHKGGYFEFRIQNKFSVGVDWTNSYKSINVGEVAKALKSGLYYTDLKTSGSGGISAVRKIVQDHVKNKYGYSVRNIAYIGWGNGFRGRGYSGRIYWVNLAPYRLCIKRTVCTKSCIFFCCGYGQRCFHVNRYYSFAFSVW